MKSNIVRGTSFITMEYEKQQHGTFGSSSSMLLPTIASQSELFSSIIIDGTDTTLDCSNASGIKVRVEKDIELYFRESDYTWMVFKLKYNLTYTINVFIIHILLISKCCFLLHLSFQ